MGKIESHRDLVVWRKGIDLVEGVYQLVKSFPGDERFALTQQTTRAAVAVPANVAEGHARGTRREYAQFVAIARGSLMELETYVMISERLGYTTSNITSPLLDHIVELSKMLTSLRAKLLNPV